MPTSAASASFARHGVRVGQVLLTSDDVSRRAHYRNAYRTLDKLLEMGALPVVNENDTVATDEIRFGDNDRLAALVAHLVRADLLVLLSDVDGLYDGDPRTPGTALIDEVRGPADLEGVSIGSAGRAGVGTGGMVTKVEAARIAAEAGIPVVLTSAVYAADALAGRRTGTYFHPTGKRSAPRLLWLAHASAPRGALRLDDGAVEAVDVPDSRAVSFTDPSSGLVYKALHIPCSTGDGVAVGCSTYKHPSLGGHTADEAGIAARMLDATRGAMKLQTGYVYHYALAMLLGVVALATWFMVTLGGKP